MASQSLYAFGVLKVRLMLCFNILINSLMKKNTPITAGNLDRETSMLQFLKSLKFVSELNKGVQSLKTYVYPSVLQKQAMPAIKQAPTPNIVINYQEMAGIKLTFLLPLLNNLLRSAIENSLSDSPRPLCIVILCHSFLRCQELADLAQDLVQFCGEMLEVLNLDSADSAECALKLKKSMQDKTALKSRMLIMTPSIALKLKQQMGDLVVQSVVLDKVDLLQALDFGADLIKLAMKAEYRCVFTCSDGRDEALKEKEEVEEYKQIKQSFMGDQKALIIKLNADVEER